MTLASMEAVLQHAAVEIEGARAAGAEASGGAQGAAAVEIDDPRAAVAGQVDLVVGEGAAGADRDQAAAVDRQGAGAAGAAGVTAADEDAAAAEPMLSVPLLTFTPPVAPL